MRLPARPAPRACSPPLLPSRSYAEEEVAVVQVAAVKHIPPKPQPRVEEKMDAREERKLARREKKGQGGAGQVPRAARAAANKERRHDHNMEAAGKAAKTPAQAKAEKRADKKASAAAAKAAKHAAKKKKKGKK